LCQHGRPDKLLLAHQKTPWRQQEYDDLYAKYGDRAAGHEAPAGLLLADGVESVAPKNFRVRVALLHAHEFAVREQVDAERIHEDGQCVGVLHMPRNLEDLNYDALSSAKWNLDHADLVITYKKNKRLAKNADRASHNQALLEKVYKVVSETGMSGHYAPSNREQQHGKFLKNTYGGDPEQFGQKPEDIIKYPLVLNSETGLSVLQAGP